MAPGVQTSPLAQRVGFYHVFLHLRWLNELNLPQVERLGLVDQSLALLTILAQAEASSVPCYRGHRLLALLPHLHEAFRPLPWPALGGEVLLSEPPAAPRLQRSVTVGSRWAEAAQELRLMAGRLTVHGEQLLKSCREQLEVLETMRPLCEEGMQGEFRGLETTLRNFEPKVEDFSSLFMDFEALKSLKA